MTSSQTFRCDEAPRNFCVTDRDKPMLCRKCETVKFRCPGCDRIICPCKPIEPRLGYSGHLVGPDWVTCFRG